MTDIICALLGLIENLFMALIPELSLAPTLAANLPEAIETVVDFLVKVNFIVPLPDIFYIISIDIGLRLFKVAVFGSNWVIRRICDLIP